MNLKGLGYCEITTSGSIFNQNGGVLVPCSKLLAANSKQHARLTVYSLISKLPFLVNALHKAGLPIGEITNATC
jgi:hypothetical protein